MRRVIWGTILGGMFALSLGLLAFMIEKLARLGWRILFIPPETVVRHIEWGLVSCVVGPFFGLVVVSLLVSWRRRDKPLRSPVRPWMLSAWMMLMAVQICARPILISHRTPTADEALAMMGIDEAELVGLPPCEQVKWLVRLSPYVEIDEGRPFIGGRILASEGPMFGASSTYELTDCVVREGLVLLEQADRGRRNERAWWAAQVLAEFLVGLYWRYDYLGDPSKQEPKPDLSYPEAQYFLHQMSCPPVYPNYGLLVEMYYRSRFGRKISQDWGHDWSYDQVLQVLCGEEWR